ncbi:MAG: OmpA family protein [Gammaproteobacteria bacterium]
MSSLARRHRQNIDIWPGFVDVLGTLLQVFIFMVVVFVFGQFYLSDALSKRAVALDELKQRMDALLVDLGQERQKSSGLRRENTELRDQQVNALAKNVELQLRLTEAQTRIAQSDQDAAQTQTRLVQANAELRDLQAKLAGREQDAAKLQRDLDSAQAERARLEQALAQSQANLVRYQNEASAAHDQRETLEAKIAEAERQVAADQTALEQQRQIAAQLERAQRDLAALYEQNTQLAERLQQSAAALQEKTAALDDLRARLAKVENDPEKQVSGYRSEFFSRLREVLGDRPDIRVVGDRFLFQSELLFASGSAELDDTGKPQLDQVAAKLLDIAGKIPAETNWVLQVNGHTDKRPISTLRFRSNWELSTARALSIVRYLIERGVPPERLAATGFAEFAPLDPADNLEAYNRNRRIELKLTSR